MVLAPLQPRLRMTKAALPVKAAYLTLAKSPAKCRASVDLPVPAHPKRRNTCGPPDVFNHAETAVSASSCCSDHFKTNPSCSHSQIKRKSENFSPHLCVTNPYNYNDTGTKMTTKTVQIILCTLILTTFSQSPVWSQEGKVIKATDVRVQNTFETLYKDNCRSLMEGNTPSKPTIYNLKFQYEADIGSSEPERLFRLYEYLCFEGPYNQSYVYFGADEYQEVTHISFAVPTFDVFHENNDPYAAVKSIEVTGFSTKDHIVNAHFNEDTMALNSFAKWRGPGDAFTSGSWKFFDGQFVLQSYEVDAEYDGERKPTVIYGEGPPTDHS